MVRIEGEFTLREGIHKLILAPGNGRGFGGSPNNVSAIKKGDPPVQLYNLSKDLAETTNLALNYPERVESMTKKLSDLRMRLPTKFVKRDVLSRELVFQG